MWCNRGGQAPGSQLLLGTNRGNQREDWMEQAEPRLLSLEYGGALRAADQ